jgi:hypothetical protein
MNRTYRVLWSDAQHAFVPVPRWPVFAAIAPEAATASWLRARGAVGAPATGPRWRPLHDRLNRR